MFKLNKYYSRWSLAGMLSGLIFAVGSFWRYYILYSDTDKVIAYILLGILIMCVSFLYNKSLLQGHTIEGIEEYLSDKYFENKKDV